jgi:hypothetical protein
MAAVQPAMAQATPAEGAARTAIQEALTAGDTRRAYDAYDRFAAARLKQEPSLLGLIAADELRLVAKYASDDPRLQTEALERLARFGDAQAFADLQRLASWRPDTPVAALAYGALARLGDVEALARLSAMASSPAMRNKSSVAEAIGRSGSNAHAAALVPLLTDSDWPTRIQAIDALADLDYSAAIPDIRGRLTDDDPQVRARATIALKRLGDTSADEQSDAMLRSGAAGARLEVLRADRKASVADIEAAARQLAADADPLNRVKAAEALATNDPAAALTVLRGVAEERDSTARRLAARGLESLKPTDVALLRRLLEDQSGWVRMYAAGGVLAAAGAK